MATFICKNTNLAKFSIFRKLLHFSLLPLFSAAKRSGRSNGESLSLYSDFRHGDFADCKPKVRKF